MIFVSVFGVFSVYFSEEFPVCWCRYVVGFVGCGGWDFLLGLFGVSFCLAGWCWLYGYCCILYLVDSCPTIHRGEDFSEHLYYLR